MSALRKPRLIAVLCSDLHLSLTPPACRADKDWMETQAFYLKWLREIAGDDAFVLCAGDVFDKWNAPPELINFALENLPDAMYCVAGQHDLPNHRMDQKHRSGYGVLVRAEKIADLSDVSPVSLEYENASIQGFGWNEEIACPIKGPNLRIAVIHRYVWTVGNSYPGAPEEAHLGKLMDSLKGYDVAVFGDNHKGFMKTLKTGTTVFNCGTFIRRKSDEIKYHPRVGLLYEDGKVETALIPTEIDRFHEDAKQREEQPFNLRDFISGLEKLGEHGLDFREAVENHLRNEELDSETKEIILRAMK